MELGISFLWVDQYCIDQRCPEEKHEQIQNIDLIYQQAEITIVTTTSSDQTYGLPGVNNCSRSPPGQ
ncbi:hypothetical protein DL95DRAFT_104210 [Leptodontidium sp. 2 PMI_412]|nr:hypothetical protein DL95DRAFT_104210 [Leptodontidium sp. 2 PMI_412]